jgi:titin
VVEGNYVGTDASGTVAVANGTGVEVGGGASGNTVGGTSAEARNVISGNSGEGVVIADSATTGNVVEGNYVGTDASGSVPLANFDGIALSGTGNTVGGTAAGAGNVFSGNVRIGVAMGFAFDDVVEGNLIGVNAQGTARLSNGSFGILVAAGSGDTIGGTTAGAANVIGGLSGDGIEIDDSAAPSGTNNMVVEGNFLGTDPTGTLNFGNGYGILVEGNAVTQGVANTTISGNVIDNEFLAGVEIYGIATKNTVVEGNFIGTDPTGTLARGNGTGVEIGGGAFDNTVGGTTVAARNVISGNNDEGVYITGSGTSGNVVEGNYVGTDVSGSVGLANFEDGVIIGEDGGNNTVGGTTAGAGNVLSGNVRTGMYFAAAFNDVLEGNLIGINAQGTAVLSNGSFGVIANGGGSGDTIGGTAAGAANVIGGLSGEGIQIDDSGASSGTNNMVVEGNFLGTDPTGKYNFGNAIGIILEGNAVTQGVANCTISGNVIDNEFLVGVEIYGIAAQNNLVEGNLIGTDSTGTQAHGNGIGVEVAGGAYNNTIGGITAGAGNVIGHNSATGVVIGSSVTDTATVGNSIRGNSIYRNGGLGIDLGNDGVTPNHQQNPTAGPNHLQNFPVLTHARLLPNGDTLIQGVLHSALNATFTLDFYASATPNPSKHGEGQHFLGSLVVTTDPLTGNVQFQAEVGPTTRAAQVISATATDSGGDTSEFSFDIALAPLGDHAVFTFEGTLVNGTPAAREKPEDVRFPIQAEPISLPAIQPAMNPRPPEDLWLGAVEALFSGKMRADGNRDLSEWEVDGVLFDAIHT